LLDILQAWVLRSQHNAHELLLRIFQILDQNFRWWFKVHGFVVGFILGVNVLVTWVASVL